MRMKSRGGRVCRFQVDLSAALGMTGRVFAGRAGPRGLEGEKEGGGGGGFGEWGARPAWIILSLAL